MSTFDIGFAIGSLVVAILLIIWSPLYRAIVFECLFHPRSNGWIVYDEDGSVHVYREKTPPDSVPDKTSETFEKTHRAVEEGERKE